MAKQSSEFRGHGPADQELKILASSMYGQVVNANGYAHKAANNMFPGQLYSAPSQEAAPRTEPPIVTQGLGSLGSKAVDSYSIEQPSVAVVTAYQTVYGEQPPVSSLDPVGDESDRIDLHKDSADEPGYLEEARLEKARADASAAYSVPTNHGDRSSYELAA